MSLTKGVTFRVGRPEDSSDLAIILDAASRRMAAWYWSTIADAGQSWFEVGRSRVRSQPETDSYHRNWHVAERQGQTIGALFGFSVPDPYDRPDPAQMPAPLRAMYELEVVAKGCWMLQAVTLFPEHRGQGHGPDLMERACQAARDAGHHAGGGNAQYRCDQSLPQMRLCRMGPAALCAVSGVR
jgi:GNAT superfamily N-acetyltransferase